MQRMTETPNETNEQITDAPTRKAVIELLFEMLVSQDYQTKEIEEYASHRNATASVVGDYFAGQV